MPLLFLAALCLTVWTGSASSADRQEILSYLVNCALPEGTVFETRVEGGTQRFPGGLGLAPDWAHRPLSASEQRWLSACLLARTNYFGKKVEISLRTRSTGPAALRATPGERTVFSLFEGGFYGNLFTDNPVGFVCKPDRPPEHESDPILRLRVCTEPSGQLDNTGAPLTRCGFVLRGNCSTPEKGNSDSSPPDETIYVFLRPAR